MKHCFWNNCSFRVAEASLSERGLTRPSAGLRARSNGLHPPVTPPPADVDVSHLSSLGSVGSGAPSIVNAAKSLLSFSRSYDSQLDKIINNSALQELLSPAMPRSPALVPDAGGTSN